uniref:Uncharacterized protein n=1 Tax=Anguilla anguilla TaxID=7936 RepID=A0A0E9S6K1_ANGAN
MLPRFYHYFLKSFLAEKRTQSVIAIN